MIGRRLTIEFADYHETVIGPEAPLAFHGEVRHTSAVLTVKTWSINDEWPGQIPAIEAGGT